MYKYENDPYFKTDGYNAYQSRELVSREYKDGKVFSTYRCSNMGGEVDIFTTIMDPIDSTKNNKSKLLDSIILCIKIIIWIIHIIIILILLVNLLY